ncbi:unnamed protein product [Brassica napus]|uniref:(rape) hypothetical protein n=1 Tax=Brassica napus TaxID=3708 RepID=A0A816PCP1_BRANA|nr:unnamed protein product [Brassica napus]
MHERLSGGSGENVASDHIGNLVSDLRENQPKWWSDKRNETLTDISGGYLRYMQVSAFDGGEDWSNYSREILTTSKEVVGSAVGSSLSFLFSINISFSDSEWAWDTHDRVATRDAWIYQNKEIQKLGREKCLTNASMEALLLHILTLATDYYGWSLGVLNMLFQGGIYRVLHARIGITPTLLWLVQPGCSRCLLKKAEMLDTRAQ